MSAFDRWKAERVRLWHEFRIDRYNPIRKLRAAMEALKALTAEEVNEPEVEVDVETPPSSPEAASSNDVVSIDPDDINFSQSSVNNVDLVMEKMSQTGWNELDPIDVVQLDDGSLVTLDNTRLLAADRLGVNVQARVHQASDPMEQTEANRNRFGDAATWGEALEGRIQGQSRAYRGRYPSGSYTTSTYE